MEVSVPLTCNGPEQAASLISWSIAAMTDRIIERVARVLSPSAFDPTIKFSSMNAKEAEKARAISKARAIFAAIREPTAAMDQAGFGIITPAGIWRAMIDAALQEEKGQ